MIKYIAAALFSVGISIGTAGIASADGQVGCSNPCVISDDATEGEWSGDGYTPGELDDDLADFGAEGAQFQNMDPFTYDPTWPGGPNQTTEDFVNTDGGK